jgi:hypothetical protein
MTDTARENRPTLQRVDGGSSRGPVRLAVLLAALVAVAVLKPWDAIAGPTPSAAAPSDVPASAVASAASTPQVVGLAGPGPTATPVAEVSLDPSLIPCRDPDGWRLVTADGVMGAGGRSWIVVAPTPATGPADAALAPVLLADRNVGGMGFCGDGQKAGAAPAVILAAFRWAPSGVWERMGVAASMNVASGPNGAAALMYSPGDADTWQSGRYAFEIVRGSQSVWLRLDLVWPPVYQGGAGSPVSSGAAAPSAVSVPSPRSTR